MTGKRSVRTDVINDTEGRALTESVDILKRWEEYCGKLYTNQDGDNDNNRLDQKCDYDREPPPLRSEVEWALGEEGVDILWRICKLIWKKGEWPKDWCRAVFIPIPKKGNLKECSNYCTISLIVHASKVLLNIIKGRIKLHYDREMAEEQAGFVEGKGTREQIVNIRIIIEKCRDQNIPLYMCFIDYAKAFDCVSHRKLWDTMEQMGFPVHIIQLVANLYKEQESVVRTTNGDTDWFKIERGVRQGCVISPGLYNIYSEHIMRCVLEEHHDGITIGGRRETNLRFADDTTLLCTSKEELLGLLKKVKEASMSKNLLLNTHKTKIMVVDKDRERKEDFVLDGEKIEEVESFVYLGSLINTKGSSAQEIRRRLAMGRGAVQNMASIWKSRGMSLGLKVLGPLLFP